MRLSSNKTTLGTTSYNIHPTLNALWTERTNSANSTAALLSKGKGGTFFFFFFFLQEMPFMSFFSFFIFYFFGKTVMVPPRKYGYNNEKVSSCYNKSTKICLKYQSDGQFYINDKNESQVKCIKLCLKYGSMF